MYQALYRKYRPTTFEDVCGQEHITSVLKTQLQTGKISHAYIFCGSRGTGKTTCAKILAKAVNCENPVESGPCNQCPSCLAINEERVLDVVEMDAASNNGVDHIRRLCDEVQFMPSELKKRVYIIDEVHMLSNSAFNALLKTIEEPPAHVLFILATTEMHEIPATIMSRCQRFDFKRITPQVITKRLLSIAEKENIALKPGAAQIIARLSDGAMRDALSLLEACQGYVGEITAESIHNILGLSSRDTIISLSRAIAAQDTATCLSLVNSLYEKMSDFKEIIGELISIYRDLLVIKSVPDYKSYVEGYENEIPALEEIAQSISLETVLYQAKVLEEFYAGYDRITNSKKASSEIMMIRLCNETLSSDMDAVLSRLSKLENGTVSVASTPKKAEKTEKIVNTTPKTQSFAQETKVTAKTGDYEGSVKLKNLLQNIAYIKPWLEQMRFVVNEEKLELYVSPFVKGILESSDAKEKILESAKKITPEIFDVVFLEEKNKTGQTSSGFEGL